MNRAESERLQAGLDSLGYAPADSVEKASLVILNSCVVRQHAEDRVVNKLSNLKALKKKHPGMQIALTGCMVGSDKAELERRFPYVDYFFKPGETPRWLDSPAWRLPHKPGVSALVSIIQGCNNFCTYCIVPYRRGREKSRTPVEIVDEVAELTRCAGCARLHCWTDVDSYGHDLHRYSGSGGLLAATQCYRWVVAHTFLTNHPKDMSQKLIKAIALSG